MSKHYVKSYYQSYDCEGYQARVTVEWSAPFGVELPPERAEAAELIADDIISRSGMKPREIVQAMRGNPIDPEEKHSSGLTLNQRINKWPAITWDEVYDD